MDDNRPFPIQRGYAMTSTGDAAFPIRRWEWKQYTRTVDDPPALVGGEK